MSTELSGNSKTELSPTPRELAATLFRRPRLVAASFAFVVLATMLFVVFSARYESHFKVLLRRGRFAPSVSPPTPERYGFHPARHYRRGAQFRSRVAARRRSPEGSCEEGGTTW